MERSRGHYLTRAARRLGLLRHVVQTSRLVINGRTFRMPIIGGLNEDVLYTHSGFKTQVVDLVTTHVACSEFVDVGANIGQTLAEAVSTRPSLRYVAIEPNPFCAFVLTRIIEMNGLSGRVLPVACAIAPTILKLYRNSAGDTGASVVPDARPGGFGEDFSYVAAFPFDDVEREIAAAPNFLMKIDVEGAELLLLRGAERTLRAKRPVVLCEVLHAHAGCLEQSRRHKADLAAYLGGLDYVIYRCVTDGSERLTAIEPIAEFPVRMYVDAPNEADYLFVPRELAALHEAIGRLWTRRVS